MEILETNISDVLILCPRVFNDARGYFFESFSQRLFDDKIGRVDFVQDNQSKSSHGVLRGLHFQAPPYAQAKLVRCTLGEILDIAVDIRKGSPTFGRHVAVVLSEENHKQLFIPHGFAHGFVVLSETAILQYKCDNYYHPESEGGLNILDKGLSIDIPVDRERIIMSDKDKRYPDFKDFETPFVYSK